MVCFLGERGRAVLGCAVGVGLGEGMQTSLPSAGFVVFAGGEAETERKHGWVWRFWGGEVPHLQNIYHGICRKATANLFAYAAE